MRRLVAVAAAAAVLLSGCTGGEATTAGNIADIVVNNGEDGAPVFTIDAGLEFNATETIVAWNGEGPVIEDGQQLLLDMYAQSLETGEVLTNTYIEFNGEPGLPEPFLMAPELLGQELYEALDGLRIGARVLHVSATTDGYEDLGPIALVVDVLPARALGTAQGARDDLPLVTTEQDGTPLVTLRADQEEPIELVSFATRVGDGDQVHAGSWVLVNYVGITFANGQLWESNWGAEQAPLKTQIGVGEVIQGWDEGLLDYPVGSQVLLMVPAAKAWGEESMVFVVDILAVWEEAE